MCRAKKLEPGFVRVKKFNTTQIYTQVYIHLLQCYRILCTACATSLSLSLFSFEQHANEINYSVRNKVHKCNE